MRPSSDLRFAVRFPGEHSPLSEQPRHVLQQKWISDLSGHPDEWRDVPSYIEPGLSLDQNAQDAKRWQAVRDAGCVWDDSGVFTCGRLGGSFAEKFADQLIWRKGK